MMQNAEPESAPPKHHRHHHHHHRHHHHHHHHSNVESLPMPIVPPVVAGWPASHPGPFPPAPVGMPYPGPSMHSSYANPIVAPAGYTPMPKMIPLEKLHSGGGNNQKHHSQPNHLVKPRRSQPQLRLPTPHVQQQPVTSPYVSHAPYTHSHPTHQLFQYSRCSGKKKALCIGINYTGQRNALRGCINDATSVMKGLINHCGFKPEGIVLLTDNSKDARCVPTRKNMIEAMHWLVQDAQPHDSLFIHYSGHGGQTPDRDGDEIDGFDEVIFPIDFKQNGHIVDDELHDILVRPLPPGCRLTGVFDSCHSGTVLDLPFMYSSSGRLKGSQVSRRARVRKASPADVISWSGCRDDQNSADTFADGKAVGAMSNAFMTALRNNPNQSYYQLLRTIRQLLQKDFSQKPQLGSSHHIDINMRFVI